MERFYSGVGESLPFKDETFNVISTYQTLEHVQSHKRCFEEFNRVLKRGGIYLLDVLTILHFLKGITEYLCFPL